MIPKIRIGLGMKKKAFVPKLHKSQLGMPKIKFNTGLGGIKIKR